MACGPPDTNGAFVGEKQKCRDEGASCPYFCLLQVSVQPYACEGLYLYWMILECTFFRYMMEDKTEFTKNYV